MRSFFKARYEITASAIKIFLLNSIIRKDANKENKATPSRFVDSLNLLTHIFQSSNNNIILFHGPTGPLYLNIEIIIMIESSFLDKPCYFFNCYFANPRPSLGYCQRGSLNSPILFTAFTYFDPNLAILNVTP